ncbi:MAG: ABC transporter substrate-binding protein, partial [Chloroflexota bacterium]|nr:ABC transporter substrate-binding protein [Chloroflexota bacterium]
MTRTTRWSPLALIGTVAIIASACAGAASPSPSSPAASAPGGASAPASAPASSDPFDAVVYPADGDAPCGTAPYTGAFKKISALDAKTVEFQLCSPDVAFLSKVAFSAFGIQDSAYLDANAASKAYLDKPNGTGPYKLKSWEKGSRMVFEANADYWGSKALT